MKPLFELDQVDVAYSLGKQQFFALRNISLQGGYGETIGIVGESGSGKSTLAKVLMMLLQPVRGRVFFEGHDVLALRQKEKRHLRRNMQMIFQDPDASLNPRMTVFEHLKEAILCSEVQHAGSLDAYMRSLLDIVQLPWSLASRYSYQLSGGQKQRVSIARALSVKPKLIICDEPFSALDISVVSQMILLLKQLQEEQKISYLFITHDLASLSYLAHRVVVLYLGQIMEMGSKEAIFSKPLHPYTQALISSIPNPYPKKEKSNLSLCVLGDPPSVVNPPAGCLFHTRCPYASEMCRQKAPHSELDAGGRLVTCHLYTDFAKLS